MAKNQPSKPSALQVIQVGPEQRNLCWAIRDEVFVQEQKIAASEDRDELDDECLHWLAWLGSEPAGTARLRIEAGVAVAQRVAVRSRARRRGIGRALMSALERGATQNGCALIRLHAQDTATEFYRALDYSAEGDFFLEAGILHLSMSKRLTPPPMATG